jgi:hypothetical protein
MVALVRWGVAIVIAALAACSHTPGGEATIDAPGGSGSIDAPLIDAGVDAGPCGMRTDRRGKTSRTIQAAGATRTYIIYLPVNDDPHTPVPLVYVFHGYLMSGEDMYDFTGYPALADTDHIALAFPDGESGPDSVAAPWNVGSDVCPATAGLEPPASNRRARPATTSRSSTRCAPTSKPINASTPIMYS